MPNYRRHRAPGGSYFFTVNLLDRHSNMLVSEIRALRDAVRQARLIRPFHTDAWMVFPDHLPCLWTLPSGDADFPTRWRMIKALFSRRVAHPEDRRLSLNRKREAGVWQSRYWEHTIRDDLDDAAHMDDIHFNPVKHGVARIQPHGRSRPSAGAWREEFTRTTGRPQIPVWPTPANGWSEDGGLKSTLCVLPKVLVFKEPR